jgi:hypothetical protein
MEPDRVLDWYRSEFLTTICRKLFAAESALPPIDLLQAHAASAKIRPAAACPGRVLEWSCGNGIQQDPFDPRRPRKKSPILLQCLTSLL